MQFSSLLKCVQFKHVCKFKMKIAFNPLWKCVSYFVCLLLLVNTVHFHKEMRQISKTQKKVLIDRVHQIKVLNV